jgi:hypothetical protein
MVAIDAVMDAVRAAADADLPSDFEFPESR